MSPNLNTIEGYRCHVILHRLQYQIGQLLPNIKDFFEYRDEILRNEIWNETKGLVGTEESLRQKNDWLEKRMNQIKDCEKKKEFVDTRAKLQSTRSKLKDVSKLLSRIFSESSAVMDNEAKLRKVFDWMNQKLERDSIETFLTSQTGDIVPSKIAIENNQNMTDTHASLQSDITTLKKRSNRIAFDDAELLAISERIKQIQRDIQEYREGKNEALRSHRVQMDQMKEAAVRENKQIEIQKREEIEKIRTEIENERVTQIDILSFYSKHTSIIQKELDQNRDEWLHKLQEVRIHQKDKIEERENNLKVLLELRLAWQQSENKKELELKKKLRLQSEREDEDRQHHAATILQNKVKVMYLSKLKKKTSKTGGKKKKPSKGKKKKK